MLDLFTRRVVGWAFSTRPDADLVVQALEMAYEQRGRSLSECLCVRHKLMAKENEMNASHPVVE